MRHGCPNRRRPKLVFASTQNHQTWSIAELHFVCAFYKPSIAKEHARYA